MPTAFQILYRRPPNLAAQTAAGRFAVRCTSWGIEVCCFNDASGCLCCYCHVFLVMEDEWYSGADTSDGTGGGGGGALAGGGAKQRTPYGDSFTPPSSQSGIMAGQQVPLQCSQSSVLQSVEAAVCYGNAVEF